MQSYPEGTIADGPNGPIVFRGGQWVPAGGNGPQTIGAPKPGYQYEGPKAATDLQNAQLETQAKRIAIEKARRELANTPDPDAPVTPTSKVSGAEYLKTLSPADAALTKSLAEGRMAFPTGAGLRSPYWQKALQNVANYDPSFDAVNYGARAATRKDFTSGKSAQNIKALNTAIGHVGQLYDQINGTMSTGGYPFATTVNKIGNSLARGSGDPGVTKFSQTAGAVASELTQVFRGTGGAEADVKRYLEEMDPNASLEQKRAAVQNIMGLLKSRLDAIGDQYTKGMGTTAQPLNLLDDHAQKVWNAVNGGAAPGSTSVPPVIGSGPPTIGGGGGAPPGGGGPTGPQSNPLNYAQGQYGDATNTEVAGATKSIPNELGIKFMGGLNALFHAGASDERIRAYASQFGVDPSAQLAYRKANPGFRGSIPPVPGGLSLQVPVTDPMSKIANAMAGSPTGTFVGEAGNAAGAGIPQWTAAQLSGNPDLARARFGVARAMNPRSAIGGELIGGTLGAIGGETAALKGAGALGKLGNVGEGAMDALNFGARRAADAGYGATSGLTGAEPGQGGSGAVKGALAGTFGGLLGEGMGRYAIEPTTRPIGRLFGNAPATPSPADNALFKAVGNNAPDINAQLGEAANLDLPMMLADTNPALRSLAGAAVRRSPNASGIAENVLIPRNRGQIDRFGAAINRDLGPIGNVPQTSQELQAAARAKAGPLYDQAYAAGPINDPELTALLNNPQMKPAFDAANMFREQDATLAAARGQPVPPPLADPNAPDIRTLDYIKRGLDGKIRTAFTGGDPQAAMSGPFYKDARNILLSKADAAVPAYAQARLSYGGPMRAMDAMEAGQKAVRPGMTADQLGVDLGKIGLGDMPQIQLGYRSGLMDQANNIRTNGNPYEATLGTPNAEAKLNAVFPDNANVTRLLRQRDLERQMQATSNDILGNSKTAQRGIADEAFAGEDLPQIALDTGLNLMTGQVPIGTMVKAGMGQSMRDAIKFGVGKRAAKKADILAPTLLNPDPAASSAELADILARSQGYRDYLARRQGMFGRALGMGGAGALTGYSTSQ